MSTLDYFKLFSSGSITFSETYNSLVSLSGLIRTGICSYWLFHFSSFNRYISSIVNSARVIQQQICYDIKDANQLYEICATRFKLHKMIYNHKAGVLCRLSTVKCRPRIIFSAKAIEYMIIDALLAAEPYLRIAERVFDPEKFILLNDSILNTIESSTATVELVIFFPSGLPDSSYKQELAESRAIVLRIRDRDLYKMVDYKVIEWPFQHIFRTNVTSKRILKEVKRRATADPVPDDFAELEGMTWSLIFVQCIMVWKKRTLWDLSSFTPSKILSVCAVIIYTSKVLSDDFRLSEYREGGLLNSPTRLFCRNPPSDIYQEARILGPCPSWVPADSRFSFYWRNNQHNHTAGDRTPINACSSFKLCPRFRRLSGNQANFTIFEQQFYNSITFIQYAQNSITGWWDQKG